MAMMMMMMLAQVHVQVGDTQVQLRVPISVSDFSSRESRSQQNLKYYNDDDGGVCVCLATETFFGIDYDSSQGQDVLLRANTMVRRPKKRLELEINEKRTQFMMKHKVATECSSFLTVLCNTG